MRGPNLFLEALEDRLTPALYDVPWLDPMHLSFSFAADGTPIVAHHSELVDFLDQRFQGNRELWQGEFARAFQTWAHQAHLNIGLWHDRITSPELPFGIAGRTQSDARFGDIRIGGQAMPGDVLSIAAAPDPFLGGTLGGDIFLNHVADINAKNLFPILLHEIGHALGLDHSDDPLSVMFSHFNKNTALNATDLANIQRLYGERGADQNENCSGHGVCEGNDSPKRATDIKHSNIPSYLGVTPLVVYGDIQSGSDRDFFRLHSISDYSGPVTFRLQTQGISPALLRMTLHRGDSGSIEHTYGAAATWNILGDVATFTIPDVTWQSGTRYYAEIESDSADLFGIGRYALGVTFDDVVNPSYRDVRLPQVMRGRYDIFREDADRVLAEIFERPDETLYYVDGGTDDTADTALRLEAAQGFRENSRYEINATVESDRDRDFYLARSPRADQGKSVVLTTTLLSAELNPTLPLLLIHEGDGEPIYIGVDLLLNGNGTYVMQAVGLLPETNYIIYLFPRAGDDGNYSLILDFGEREAALDTYTEPAGQLSESEPTADYAFYVGRSQFFQFVLNAGDLFDLQAGSVRMELFDKEGAPLYTLLADAGNAASNQALFLVPGEYLVRFIKEGGDSPPSPMSYRLRGITLTDPIGPALGDSLLQPRYVCEDDPELFCYPGDILSQFSFLWVLRGT